MPTAKEFTAFRRTVYGYYAKHKRDLSWRHTTNPYKILVSEIMLQQTQVPRVEVKYREFLRAFPTVKKLAEASLGDVLRVWQGMGYNRRAKMLHEAAKAIVRDHGGRFPKDTQTLTTLPGVGPSTAGGICAYAYDMPVVFIETNIRRVFIHHFFADTRGVVDKDILPLVEIACDKKHPREWYSALMDYGTHLAATVENPNRRSGHYTKQKPFNGSDREVRGAILKILVSRACSRAYLLKQLPFDKERTLRILADLERESLITHKKTTYVLGS
ncbi:MAG: A/G-specific adenine glycosylase [Candidatus Yonathbacteria bacterium]|nr:A/G-specific adenine glycosylase [Candidatus Yonathbacteria bacterium]